MRLSILTALLGFIASPFCIAMDSEVWTSLVPEGTEGVCDVALWKKNWPGCSFEDGVSEGHLLLTKRQSAMFWQVRCVAGGIGPEQGGVGWRWPFSGLTKSSETRRQAELRYVIRFEPGFEFVKGGKLPGLCGGPKTITGGDKCTGFDGWSVRLMWRRDGRGQAYIYHPKMAARYGDEIDFDESFRFPINEPIRIRMAVAMNDEEHENGSLRVWIQLQNQPEVLMVQQTDMQWTKDPKIGVDSLLFNVFHGGNDKSWAPSQDCLVSIAGIEYR